MLTPNEIKYVVNDCKAKAIITSSEKVSQITDLKEEGQINFIISFGETPFDNKWRNLPTRVVVFPVPGPARTKLNCFFEDNAFF